MSNHGFDPKAVQFKKPYTMIVDIDNVFVTKIDIEGQTKPYII